jgi:hypothetical protein
MKHRFGWGRPAHSDVNAALNHARLGDRAPAPRADANRPHVEETQPCCSLDVSEAGMVISMRGPLPLRLGGVIGA